MTTSGGSAGDPGMAEYGGSGAAPPGECWLSLPGATGEEPDELIPVCCIPTATEGERRDEFLEALNQYRADEGLSPLSADAALQAAAQGFGRHMDEHPFFDSTAPESVVGTVWEVATRCGAHVTAANLAVNEGGPLDVLDTWVQAGGTNQWLVHPDFTRVGLGTHGYTWCLMLD